MPRHDTHRPSLLPSPPPARGGTWPGFADIWHRAPALHRTIRQFVYHGYTRILIGYRCLLHAPACGHYTPLPCKIYHCTRPHAAPAAFTPLRVTLPGCFLHNDNVLLSPPPSSPPAQYIHRGIIFPIQRFSCLLYYDLCLLPPPHTTSTRAPSTLCLPPAAGAFNLQRTPISLEIWFPAAYRELLPPIPAFADGATARRLRTTALSGISTRHAGFAVGVVFAVLRAVGWKNYKGVPRPPYAHSYLLPHTVIAQ